MRALALVMVLGCGAGRDPLVHPTRAELCGGGCLLKGGTFVERCVDLLSPKLGCNGADCAGCRAWVAEAPCDFNGPQKPETIEDLLGPAE